MPYQGNYSMTVSTSSRVTLSTLRQQATVPAIGAGIFLLLTVLVHFRVLADLDLAVARFVAPLGSDSIDGLGEAVAVAVSAEFSLFYAAVAAFLFWRWGAGRWSLTPFAFVLGEPIEVIWKLIVNQPLVPSEFYRSVAYPLATLVLQGSFPSGHAMRSAFFCAFVAGLLRTRGGPFGWIGPAVCVVVALLCGFTRIYLGYHWFSDVAAGLILGASLGLYAAGIFTTEARIYSRQPSEDKQ